MSPTFPAFPGLPESIVASGRSYYRQGRVRLEVEGESLRARVLGTKTHTVTLKREPGRIVTTCTCTYADGNRAVCKHAVATTLAAMAQGDIVRAPRTRLVSGLEAGSPAAGHGRRGESSPERSVREFLFENLRHAGVVRADELRPGAQRSTPTVTKTAARDQAWPAAIEQLGRPAHAGTQQKSATGIARSHVRFVLDSIGTLHAGRLEVRIEWQQPRKDGEMGLWKPLDLALPYLPLIEPPATREVLGLLAASSSERTVYYADSASMRVSANISVPTELAPSLLPLLAGTGALFADADAAGAEGVLGPIPWQADAPWEILLDLSSDVGHGKILLTANLARGDERRSLAEPLLLLSSGVVVFPDHAAPLHAAEVFSLIPTLRRDGVIAVPMSRRADLVAHLKTRLPSAPIHIAPELEMTVVTPTPIHRATLHPIAPVHGSPELEVILEHEYAGLRVDEHAPATLVDRANDTIIRRDEHAERAASVFLGSLGVRRIRAWIPGRGRCDVRSLAPKRMPATIRALVSAGWKVEAEGALYRSVSKVSSRITSGIDWFDLHAEASFGDEIVQLPALLEALTSGSGLVRLGDGSFGLLPEEWLRRFGQIGNLGKVQAGTLRFSRTQGGLLDALLTQMPELTADAAFAKARAKLSTFAGAKAADAPARFVGTLREYQREGLGWLKGLRQLGLGGVLADDMGLGKTVQVLALLAGLARKRGGKPCLVVAPRSLLFNWQEEAQRFAPKLRVLEHSGLERSKDPGALAEHDLILTTYGTLRRDIVMLRDMSFDVVVLDEAQAIKNAKSDTAKAARLLQANQRVALSGTPIENHLGELWSLFEFLNPGILGSSSAFATIARPGREIDDDTLGLIAGAVRPFVLRRTKKQVAPELPDRVEQTITCVLDDKQRKLYDELRDHYRASLSGRLAEKGMGASTIHVLEALLRLRQAACHPGLIDPRWNASPSTKLDMLVGEIENVLSEGHAALVFSQFTSFLALLRERLDALAVPYCYLDGQTPPKQRQAQVKTFQDGGPPLFLISLKAGGLGLNLTRAEYVFLLDPWWNPAVEAQAIDRAHRIGQRHTVLARRLVAKDTVEERILELQATKRGLADAILSSDGSILGRLTREELDHLLS